MLPAIDRTTSGAAAVGRLSGLELLEQEAIARLDERRREVVRLESEIKQIKDDSRRFGESQGDPAGLSDRLRDARRQFEDVRGELDELRTRQRGEGTESRPRASITNNFLEQRFFARHFPADARSLKAFQFYDQRGDLQSFSLSELQFVGTVVDARI